MLELKDRHLNIITSPPDKRDYDINLIVGNKKQTLCDDFTIPYTSKIYDQEDTMMCGGFVVSSLSEIFNLKETGKREHFSAGFIFGFRNKTDFQGNGVHTRQLLKNWQKFGICKHKDFPYLGDYKELKEKIKDLPKNIFDYAKKYRIDSYYKIDKDDNDKTMQVLYELELPVIFSIPLYTNWNYAFDGVVFSPSGVYTGGHLVHVIGWKNIDNKMYWVVHNSWGKYAGDNGYYYLPFDYPVSERWVAIDYIPKQLNFTFNSKEYYINNKTHYMDVVPNKIDDLTYLPIRFVAEGLGYKVIWDEEKSNAVNIKDKDLEINLLIGENLAFIKNNQKYDHVKLKKKPFLDNNRTYLLDEDIAKILDCKTYIFNNEIEVKK